MALLARAFVLEEINGWDETALHDHLRANPSLRQDLGFKTLPNQSTFWRAWNNRCSEELRDAVQECADAIVKTARACEVPLPAISTLTKRMSRKPTTTRSPESRSTSRGSRARTIRTMTTAFQKRDGDVR